MSKLEQLRRGIEAVGTYIIFTREEPIKDEAAMQAYRDIGFDGPMRPDHVPQMAGEEDGEPGYTMLGRLFAYGYMRGLMHGISA